MLKKILAFALAGAMVIGSMSLTSFAATNNLTNDKTLTVTGLEAGDTVYYYKVIEWEDSVGWKFTDQFASLATNTNAQAAVTNATGAAAPNARITALAADKQVLAYITGLPSEFTTDADGNTTSLNNKVDGQINSVLAGEIAKLANTALGSTVLAGDTWTQTLAADPDTTGAGLYLVLVAAGNSGVVYNPIFVASDFYNPEEGGTPGENETDEWAVQEGVNTYSDSAFAKKKKNTVEKKVIDDVTGVDGQLTDLGFVTSDGRTYSYDDASASKVGDIVQFEVKTTMPVYASNYADIDTESLVFNVYDSLSTGLELVNDGSHPVVVKADGSDLTAGASTYTVTANNGATGDNALKVEFAKSYIKNGTGTSARTAPVELVITYYAKVTDTAIYNINPENNSVQIEFTNNPNNLDNVGVLKDVTNHYTFSIDADAFGVDEYEFSELIKVGVSADGTEIMKSIQLSSGKWAGVLEGCVFGLYTDPGCTTAYTNEITPTVDYTKITTNKDGKLNIKGLDVGTYYLKEVSARPGFIKSDAVYEITISADFMERNVQEDVEVITVDKSATTSNKKVNYTTKVLESYSIKVVTGSVSNGTFTGENAGTTSTYYITYQDENPTTIGTSTIYTSTGIVVSHTAVKKDGFAHSDEADNTHKLLNTVGTELPSTGGIGTTLFYAGGAVLVLLAGVLLVSKRRIA